MNPESISLYFCEGSSDKEYHAELVASGEGFLVNFRYGRRGSTLTTGTKTTAPVPYEKAKSVYDKLVGEKLKKGYSPGESGNAYQQTALAERFTGVVPQLLNAIDEDELQILIRDDRYAAQEKKDGKRCLIRKSKAVIEGINRRGLVVALPKVLEVEVLKMVSTDAVIDGELIGEAFFAFDLLEINSESIRERPYHERYLELSGLFSADSQYLRVIAIAQGAAAKQELLSMIKAQGLEGIVLKKLDAPYTAGRPASGGAQRKFKITATATCRVAKRNGTKRSASLELADGDQWICVGNVTIPANYEIPEAGSLCEVEYLYAYKGGSLFQPVYRGERDDLGETAAVMTQLKYKPESSDEDES